MQPDEDGIIKHKCYIKKLEKTKERKGKKRNHEGQLIEEKKESHERKRCNGGQLVEDQNEEADVEGEEMDGLPTYVFFDFECSQEKPIGQNAQGSIFEHQVVCGHARIVCSDCIDSPK